ncbi:MAG: hypothetical protein QF886_16250, partial [Planctomycetota bacterium]|nr:hypothetical protein [Planctomycetota bacterium]
MATTAGHESGRKLCEMRTLEMKTQSDSESPEHEEHLDQPRPQDLPIILKGWLKGAWGWFQHWRRRYCLHRLFILLFMFGPDCYRQLTRNAVLADLVSIAIGSIGVSSEPSVITARFHYFRTQRIKNLQQEILKIDHLETSSLENARATPLDCEALLLVEQAQGLGILAPEMDLPSIRQEAWVKAKQEHLLANEDNVARITKHMDDYYAPQNYLDWRTWEPGLAHLCNGVLTRWNWAGCSFLTVWVLCCALMAAAVTSFSQSRLPIILASAAAVVLIISILLADRRRIELSPGLLLFC